MSIRQLKTFLAIAELGSFAAAAERLGLTHSAISVQIRNLEDELGAALFDRARKPPALNSAGREMVPQVREIIERFDALSNQLVEDAGVAGEFRLGSVGSVLTGMLPSVLSELRGEFPKLRVTLRAGFTADLVDAVRCGELDAAIVSDFGTSGSDIRCRPFAREPLVFIAPQDAHDEPASALIKRYPFIRYAPESSAGRTIDAAIRAAKLKINEQMRLDWIEAIETMVAKGLGVSVIPQRTVGSSAAVRALPFGPKVRYRTLNLVESTRHGKPQLGDVLLERLSAVDQC